MDLPRLHVVSLPHTQTTKEYISCAYTQKVLNFCKMMVPLGWPITLYSGEQNEAPCDEHVVVNSNAEQVSWFGKFDYHSNFYPITWGINDRHWIESNTNTIVEIGSRFKKGDFICIIGGNCQKMIADAFPQLKSIEFGIGYSGVFSNFRVFESYSHMHNIYGQLKVGDGSFYDCVIPNYFDPKDFDVLPLDQRDDYFAYLGRFTKRKGIDLAVEATARAGVPLKMAGQGATLLGTKGDVKIYKGDHFVTRGSHIEHIGHVDVEQRREFLSRARALFVPTRYIEPFGGVAIEAMMSGTPVITTDWGAFTETVLHGDTGYRCRTIGEMEQAVHNIHRLLPPEKIAEYAVQNYSLDRVASMYDDYFKQVMVSQYGEFSNVAGSLFRYSRWG